MIWPVAVCFFLWGLILGSFATALAWRAPRGLSIIKNHSESEAGKGAARSACPHCHHTLGVLDLLPVFSWLLSKGRCRHCGEKISPSYPIIEFVTGCAALGLFLSWGLSWHVVVLVMVLPFLMALMVIDLKHMILPDKLNLLCAMFALLHVGFIYVAADYDVRVIVHYLSAGVFYAVFAFILGFLMSKILRKDAIGLGDVKFYLVVGLFIGFPYFSTFLILSGAFGVLLGLVWRKISGNTAFPFGPALILSLYTCLILQGLGIVPFVGL